VIDQFHYPGVNFDAKYALTDAGATEVVRTFWLGRNKKKTDFFTLGNYMKSRQLRSFFKGRLHVSESAYESPYDSVQDLHANRIGSQFFFCYPIAMVCLHISVKTNKNLLA
jgi:hypothetical protein